MNKKKISIVMIILVLALVNNPIRILAAEDGPILHIETNNNKVLFDLYNLKPGDWGERKLTVQNRGEQDFTYTSISRLDDGSEKLYNEFLLEVSDSEGVLYEGKMKDFNGFPPRLLKAEHEEELLFTVEFPPELGNEFQGLEFDVVFAFYIEDLIEPNEPGNPSENPDKPDEEKNPDQPGNPGTDDPDKEDPDDNKSPTPPKPEQPGNNEVIYDSEKEQSDQSSKDSAVDEEESNAVGEDDNNVPEKQDEQQPEEQEDSSAPSVEPEKEQNDSNEMVVRPQQPMTPDTLNSSPSEGQVLPDTATNMFNYIVAGIVLIAAGSMLLLIIRKRKLSMKF